MITESNQNYFDNTDDLFGEVIAEKFIPFDYEVSIVGARFKMVKNVSILLTHNLQQNGILRYSVTDISFPQQQSQQIQAESMLGKNHG
ncbi:ATP-grasp domain-containing protein [Haemophilus parainfluenzae]|uniref:ATP-grasp domain-containing protein n=1 Tax=Haemophilus parainfluenzae TaxID=729 RepID=UPI003B21DAA4